MQTLILTTFALLCSIKCYAQSFFIGYTQREILYEVIIDDDCMDYESRVINDSTIWLTWNVKSANIRTIACIEHDRCFLTIFIPNDTETMNRLVKEFNKYVIVNDKEWKVYVEDRIFKVELKYLPQIKSHFVISEIK